MTHVAADPVRESAPATAVAIQRACSCPACTHDAQSKLTLGTPGDRYEQEADRIADQVTSDRAVPLAGPLPVTPMIQRQVEEEEEEEMLQPKAQGTGATAGAIQQAAQAVNQGGRPLPASERAYFEPRFGRDLSAVRIHDSAGAAAAAREIKARAYTLGSNIAFAPGEFAPQTQVGRHLIAHELTHTLQQRGHRAPRRIHRVPQTGTGTRTPQLTPPTPSRSLAGLAPRLRLLSATMEMCRRSDTASILARIDADNVEIRLFRSASERWRLADGTEEVSDLSRRLRGNTHIDPSTGHGIIRINENLSDRQMVETLFHEMQHWIHRQTPSGPRGLESEIQARIATEQMAIDRGWPETRRGYRTADGRVDEAFIRQQMQASPHYSPTGRTRIPGSRRYGGETTIPGPFACPPVGDFPTPRSDIAYA